MASVVFVSNIGTDYAHAPKVTARRTTRPDSDAVGYIRNQRRLQFLMHSLFAYITCQAGGLLNLTGWFFSLPPTLSSTVFYTTHFTDNEDARMYLRVYPHTQPQGE